MTTQPTPSEPETFVWIEDAVPEGVQDQGGWEFVSAPHPVFSGKTSSTRTAEGRSQHYFQNAKQPLTVAAGDILFAHVYLDPDNPPQQIMLQFNDGSWEHRAYWGGNKIDWGTDATPSRFRKGDLPETGKWIRLEVPVDEVGLSPGAKINGWAFTQFDGTTHWDQAGIVTHAKQMPSYDSFAQWLTDQRAAQGSGVPEGLKAQVTKAAEELSEQDRQELLAHFLEHVYAATRDTFTPLHEQLAANEKSRQDA